MIHIPQIYGPAAWAVLAIKELPMMIRNNTNGFVILTPIAAVLLTIDGRVLS